MKSSSIKLHALIVSVIVGVTALVLEGQVPTMDSPSLTFEVASVKVNNSLDSRGSTRILPSGMVVVTNTPLRMLVSQAFGLEFNIERFLLVGGSEQILATRFDVIAKPPDNADSTEAHSPMTGERLFFQERTRERLRALLRDRFALRTHRETRQMPVYALTRADANGLGPDLRRTMHDCVAFAAAGGRPDDRDMPRDQKGRSLCFQNTEVGSVMTMRYAGPLVQLVRRIQPYVDRPVVDLTALQGAFEWQLVFGWQSSVPSDGPSIFTAVREQVGLRLAAQTGPVEVTVIDSVDMPTPD